MTVTRIEIDEKLAGLNVKIEKATREVERLSLAAAGGDDAAFAEWVSAKHLRDDLIVRRDLLTGAQKEVERIEDSAAAERAERDRQAHLKNARAAARDMVAVCDRIDALAKEFKELFDQLIDLEQTIHVEGRRAGEGVEGRTFQRGIFITACEHFSTMGRPIFERPDRTLHDAAVVAWGHLLATGD